MTRLYHFTSKLQLASILSTGELWPTPNPHISVPGEKHPVLWLSRESGDGITGATVAKALNLDKAVQGRLVNRTEIRFTVDVPDEEVVDWADYAHYYGVNKNVLRRLEKWPLKPTWWVTFLRHIPSSEWVEVSQGGNGTWKPILAPDPVQEEVEG